MNAALPTDRSELGDWLNRQGLVGNMAEIGCAYGGFAKSVLDVWKGGRYIMVDPWITQDPAVYRERQLPEHVYTSHYEQCAEMSRRDKRIVLLRGLSHVMAPEVEDGSLDCCYIDGNHSFEAVTQDLKVWFPKVKPGGIICGHDFYDATVDGHWCGVESAVRQWSAETSILFTHSVGCSSWWAWKPATATPDRVWANEAARRNYEEQPRTQIIGALGATIV